MADSNVTTVQNDRRALALQAAYEIESIGMVMQKLFREADDEQLAARGFGARLEELAGVVMLSFDNDNGAAATTTKELATSVYGPAWAREQAGVA